MSEIVRIYISPGHNFYSRKNGIPGEHPTLSVPEVSCVAGKGLEGDRFFDYKDDFIGQVTFFAWETYDELCARFDVTDKNPGVFRRNIITRGVDLNSLVGQEFVIQGIRFSGTQESSPCHWMNRAFCEGAEEAMQGRGGLRARILTDGLLKVGDASP